MHHLAVDTPWRVDANPCWTQAVSLSRDRSDGPDAAANTVTVGPHEALAVSTIEAVGRLHVPVSRAEVRVRHRSEQIPVSVEPTADGFRLELDEPAFAVARGQFAVLYDNDAVVGAGAIADVA
jgi:tRNA U34 2-thiouridine synthase MnmA/TrmU